MKPRTAGLSSRLRGSPSLPQGRGRREPDTGVLLGIRSFNDVVKQKMKGADDEMDFLLEKAGLTLPRTMKLHSQISSPNENLTCFESFLL